jgi:hypothetical protein
MRPKNKKNQTLSTILQILVGYAIAGGLFLFLFLVSDTRELMSIEVQLSPQYLLDIGVESNLTYLSVVLLWEKKSSLSVSDAWVMLLSKEMRKDL